MRFFLLGLVLPLHASVVGLSKPAESLTAARITATLPATQRKPWLDYLQRSQAQLGIDQGTLAKERASLTEMPPKPKEGFGTRSMMATGDDSFYKTAPALHVAETILSFQLPNGGWSKNLDMSGPARLLGQSYTPDNISHFLAPDDFDRPANPDWNYAGTLDNDATNTELHYLARISTAYPGKDGDRFRASFVRGVQYLLKAQYPNGGWPQVWPLEGGYHDAVTFNDNAVTESASLLSDTATGTGDFGFVSPALRAQAGTAANRAVVCTLRAQVKIDGKLTVWAQQSDALTLAPVAGRNFEPAALSAGESADVLVFLMHLPAPSPAVRASVEAGVAWLKANAIYGQAWVGGRRPGADGSPPVPRHLEATPGAGPIWPRYTDMQTGKAIFGDRDKTIHDTVTELSRERQNGYAWYSGGPKSALDAYEGWKAKWGK